HSSRTGAPSRRSALTARVPPSRRTRTEQGLASYVQRPTRLRSGAPALAGNPPARIHIGWPHPTGPVAVSAPGFPPESARLPPRPGLLRKGPDQAEVRPSSQALPRPFGLGP